MTEYQDADADAERHRSLEEDRARRAAYISGMAIAEQPQGDSKAVSLGEHIKQRRRARIASHKAVEMKMHQRARLAQARHYMR